MSNSNTKKRHTAVTILQMFQEFPFLTGFIRNIRLDLFGEHEIRESSFSKGLKNDSIEPIITEQGTFHFVGITDLVKLWLGLSENIKRILPEALFQEIDQCLQDCLDIVSFSSQVSTDILQKTIVSRNPSWEGTTRLEAIAQLDEIMTLPFCFFRVGLTMILVSYSPDVIKTQNIVARGFMPIPQKISADIFRRIWSTNLKKYIKQTSKLKHLISLRTNE